APDGIGEGPTRNLPKISMQREYKISVLDPGEVRGKTDVSVDKRNIVSKFRLLYLRNEFGTVHVNTTMQLIWMGAPDDPKPGCWELFSDMAHRRNCEVNSLIRP